MYDENGQFITKQMSHICLKHIVKHLHWLSGGIWKWPLHSNDSLPCQKILPLCTREDYSNFSHFHKDWTVGGEWGGMCMCMFMCHGGWGVIIDIHYNGSLRPFTSPTVGVSIVRQSKLVPVGGKSKQIHITWNLNQKLSE